MVPTAVAQETVCALRRQIAKIEGGAVVLPPLVSTPAPLGEAVTLRRDGRPCEGEAVSTGAPSFDRALGGGVPDATLLELQGAEMRDAAAAAGFALALAGLRLPRAAAPILWIATTETLREAGLPYLDGLRSVLGDRLRPFLLARAKKLENALWLAEEAIAVGGLGALILEVQGAAPRLDLTATLRLSTRAREHRRLLLLIRQGTAVTEPTAAPLRLSVGPAPAVERRISSGPLRGTIGPPAFTVTISKNRAAPPATLLLEWNSHERRFSERPKNPRAVVPLSRHGTNSSQDAGALLALGGKSAAASGALPQDREHAPDRECRRAG